MELNLGNYFSGLNLLLGMCVFILTMTVKRVFQPFWQKPLGKRLLPLLPFVFGVVLAFSGLHEPTIETWQETLAIGLVAGAMAAYAFKVGKEALFPKP